MKTICVSVVVQYYEEDDAFRDYYEFKNPYIEVPEGEIEEDEGVLACYAEETFAAQITAIIRKYYYGAVYTVEGGDYDEDADTYMLRVNIDD